jgi:hypothetical protein
LHQGRTGPDNAAEPGHDGALRVESSRMAKGQHPIAGVAAFAVADGDMWPGSRIRYLHQTGIHLAIRAERFAPGGLSAGKRKDHFAAGRSNQTLNSGSSARAINDD